MNSIQEKNDNFRRSMFIQKKKIMPHKGIEFWCLNVFLWTIFEIQTLVVIKNLYLQAG